MRSYSENVAVYSASHFFVDFACAYLVFSSLGTVDDRTSFFVVYNFLAFAMQMPIGILADSLRKNRIVAISGMIFVALGFAFLSMPWVLVCLSGFGNALFHVGGGRDILCGGKGKYAPLGIFVSPGAVGLFLGTLSGKLALVAPWIPAVVLILLSADTYLLKDYETADSLPVGKNVSNASVALLLLFLVVCLRSFGGFEVSFPWKTTVALSFITVVAVACGKAFGGILADQFGDIRISVISLAICAVLMLLYRNTVCGIAAILLFNMTMPITLGGVMRLFSEKPGFGFGLMTFGLYLGIIPVFAGADIAGFMPVGMICVCAISVVLICFGLRRSKNACNT